MARGGALWTQGPNVNRKFYTTRAGAQGREIQTTKTRHVGFDFPDKIFQKKTRDIDGGVPTSLMVSKPHIFKKTASASPLPKRHNVGGGVKKSQNFADVIYGWPLMCLI